MARRRFGSIGVAEVIINQINHVHLNFLFRFPLRSNIKKRTRSNKLLPFLEIIT